MVGGPARASYWLAVVNSNCPLQISSPSIGSGRGVVHGRVRGFTFRSGIVLITFLTSFVDVYPSRRTGRRHDAGRRG